MKIFAILAGAGIVAAIVIGTVGASDTGNLIALVLGGVASTLLVCLAFYAVGHSEDREREQRERQEARTRE
jgi:hypothetical protein